MYIQYKMSVFFLCYYFIYMNILKKVLLIACIILLIVAGFVYLRKPSHDRVWEEASAILPNVTINGDVVDIKQVRDWRYSSTTEISKDYIDRTINTKDITGANFIISHFAPSEYAAHTFFSFQIKDAPPIAVSIEARREADETYSTVKGLFNEYELWYAWGTEDDFISRRTVLYADPLDVYPLNISAEEAQKLFVEMAEITQEIETTPRWYNTAFANCTNLIMEDLNGIKQKAVPWNYSMILTGYSDEYLKELGLISS